MHWNQIKFAPNDETEFNKFIFENPLEGYNEHFKHGLKLNLPPGFEFSKATPEEFEKIFDFINRFYTGVKYDKTALNMLKDLGDEMEFYVIKYKNTICATQSVEYIEILNDGERIPAAFADMLVIHPNYRGKFLVNIMMATTCREFFKHGAKCEIMTSHRDLGFKAFTAKEIYNLPLVPSVFGKPYEIKNLNDLPKVRPATVEELNKINEIRYKLQHIYSPRRLEMIERNKLSLTDDSGKNLILFNVFYNVAELFNIKTAIILDIVRGENFKKFFKSCLNELKTAYGIELISVQNGDFNDIISAFNFTKSDSVMRYYCLNYLPKVKKNEATLVFR